MNLSNENIAKVMKEIETFFDSEKVAHKDQLKICLILEDSLIRCREKFGEQHEFKFITRKWFGTPRILIRIKDKPFNPLEEDDDGIFSGNILQELLNYENARVIYRYEGGFNEIIAFSSRKIKNLKIPGGKSTISIIWAIIFALIAKNFPADTQILIANIIEQILNTLLSAVIAANIPLIFISIVTSICAMENVMVLNELGTTILLRFLKLVLFIVIVTIFISEKFFPVVNFSLESQILLSNSDETKKILDSILIIVPQNILEPFLKGNFLQIVILAILLGICMIILCDRVSNVKNIIAEINQIILKLVSIVMKIMPIIIFLSIVRIILVYSLEKAFSLWKVIAANYISFVIVSAVMLFMISLKQGVKIRDFLREIYPACLITFTTSSGSASMPKNIEICKQKFGIKENLVDFYICFQYILNRSGFENVRPIRMM